MLEMPSGKVFVVHEQSLRARRVDQHTCERTRVAVVEAVVEEGICTSCSPRRNSWLVRKINSMFENMVENCASVMMPELRIGTTNAYLSRGSIRHTEVGIRMLWWLWLCVVDVAGPATSRSKRVLRVAWHWHRRYVLRSRPRGHVHTRAQTQITRVARRDAGWSSSYAPRATAPNQASATTTPTRERSSRHRYRPLPCRTAVVDPCPPRTHSHKRVAWMNGQSVSCRYHPPRLAPASSSFVYACPPETEYNGACSFTPPPPIPHAPTTNKQTNHKNPRRERRERQPGGQRRRDERTRRGQRAKAHAKHQRARKDRRKEEGSEEKERGAPLVLVCVALFALLCAKVPRVPG